jgi:hypothetical protein
MHSVGSAIDCKEIEIMWKEETVSYLRHLWRNWWKLWKSVLPGPRSEPATFQIWSILSSFI